MAKTLSKTPLAVFLILLILFSASIYFNLFSNVRAGMADRLYSENKAIESIVIIKIDDASINKIGRWPWDRDVFAQLLGKVEDAKIVGVDVSFFEASNNDTSLKDKLEEMDNVVLAAEINYGEAYYPIFNATRGYVNLITDYDGITRRVSNQLSTEILPFAFEMYKKSWNKDAGFERKEYLINFVSFKGIGVYEVLEGNLSFKNKIVLIGATAPNLHDNYFVPTSTGLAMSGVEIHGSILQNLILNDFLKSEGKLLIGIFVLIFGLLGMFFISKLKIYYIIPLLILILIGYVYIAIVCFSKFNYVLELFYAPLSIIIFTGAGIGVNYLDERKHNKFITEAFGKYISKDLLNEIIQKRQELKLGGMKREITIFFSDIRGFTTISEKLSPEELVSFINEYLTVMTGIILKHRGTVDKFIGDAVMALWNAPLLDKEHAKLACESAIEQIKALEELKKRWKSRKLPEINIGCGINTGDAVIGNMGSEDRFDYTALGDSVNLASRLEGLTKQYGAKIIVSESTYKIVKDKFNFRKLDRVKVKGKKIPITIYELLAEDDKSLALQFEKALGMYFDGKFREAVKEFEKAIKLKEEDLPSKLFVERCKEYAKNPPEEGWDGSFEAKNK